MKTFKKKITLSNFRKNKSKKNIESIIEPELIEPTRKIDAEYRIDEQENISTQNANQTSTGNTREVYREERDDDFSKEMDETSIDEEPVEEEDDTQVDESVNNLLSPSKEESIKRRVTEAIEKVIADIHSDDLTDDDVSSLLACSLDDGNKNNDKDVVDAAITEYQNEYAENYDSQDDVTNESYAGYGNSKLCSVFKCEKEPQNNYTTEEESTKLCGIFRRNNVQPQQQTSYSGEESTAMKGGKQQESTSIDPLTEDYTEEISTSTPRVNFCGFFG